MKGKKIWIFILGIFIFIGIFSRFIAPYSVEDISFEALLAPNSANLLGTDEMGHDILSMVLNGFTITISMAFICGTLSTVIGALLALIGACKGGIIDRIILKISDFFIMVPDIIIILFFAAFSRPSMINTIYAMTFFSWGKAYRVIRAKALEAIQGNKVKYTIMMKGSLTDILKKLWYDIKAPIITMFILQCNKAAVYETTLSYFGIGDPLAKTWGKLIKSALNYEGIFYDGVYAWYLLPPILVLVMFILTLSFLTFEKGDDNEGKNIGT